MSEIIETFDAIGDLGDLARDHLEEEAEQTISSELRLQLDAKNYKVLPSNEGITAPWSVRTQLPLRLGTACLPLVSLLTAGGIGIHRFSHSIMAETGKIRFA